MRKFLKKHGDLFSFLVSLFGLFFVVFVLAGVLYEYAVVPGELIDIDISSVRDDPLFQCGFFYAFIPFAIFFFQAFAFCSIECGIKYFRSRKASLESK